LNILITKANTVMHFSGQIYTLFILILSCTFLHAQGQVSHTLSGIIEDTSGHRVENAVITLQEKDTVTGYTLSDAAGKYLFTRLPAKEYQLIINHPDYSPLQVLVPLTADKALTHTLSPVSQVTLDSIVVVADRSNIVRSDATGEKFYLSSRARKEKSVYDALAEIPSLKIDPIERKIKTMNDEDIIILINGMQRPVSLETIDPSQIEAVEVVHNPSAKYLANGLQHVINLKLKARTQNYRILNLYAALNPELITNTESGGFETGNSRYSLFVNATGMNHNNEKGSEYGYQNLDASSKKYSYDTKFNYGFYDLTVGGDFCPGDKDYLSYSLFLNRNAETMDYDGTGSFDYPAGTSILYESDRNYDNKSWIGGGKIFYRHTFDAATYLENTASCNFSSLKGKDRTAEEGEAYAYRNDVYNKARQQSFSYSLEFQKTLHNQTVLSVGSNTAYANGSIKEMWGAGGYFRHRQWKEYLYGAWRQNYKRLSYMASAGLDFIANTNAGIKNRYYRLKFSGNCNFQLNNRHSVLLYANGYTLTPDIQYLNPANTSSDSMQVIKGNPYLEPAYVKQAGIQYRGTAGNWYIQPWLLYTAYDDIYDRVGYKEGDLYIYTYENKSKKQWLYSNLSIRYTLKNIGYIGMNGGYQRMFYEDRAKGWFYGNLNWRLCYKQFVWSGYFYAQPRTYEQYSKRAAYIDSSTSLNWNINSNWNVGATLRYFLAACKNEYWIDDSVQGYHYYVCREFPERHNMVSITVQYSWKKREKKRYNNQLQLDKSGIQLLKE